MTRVAIYGTHDDAMRLWEAFSLSGVDVVAFIDLNSRRHGRPFLSSIVQPVSWLARGRFDVVAVSDSDLADPGLASSLAIVNRSQLMRVPADASDETLTSLVAARLPSVLSPAHFTDVHEDTLRVGVFGTGSAAMKVWEACVGIPRVEVVWFSDNNPQQQGRTLFWLDVITPDDVPRRPFDFVVVGSMSRDAICTQLGELGIPPERILTPNVASDVAALHLELSSAIAAGSRQETRQ